MPLHLRIENETSLPDGGPIAITVTSKRGIDIGRDQYLDWVLPDPTRFISGKHCEIRFKDGKYWLSDVSTNGTFVNRSEFRIDRPHALQDGDRIEIGRFIIAVALEPEPAEAGYGGAGAAGAAGGAGLWDTAGDAPPPINPRELRSPSVSAGINSLDMLDWAADIPMANVVQQPIARQPEYAAPAPAQAPAAPAPAPAGDFDDWITPAPRAEMPRPARPPAEPPAPAPAPAPANAWDFGPDPAQAVPPPPPPRPAPPVPPAEPVAAPPPPPAPEFPAMPPVANVPLMSQPVMQAMPPPAPPPPEPPPAPAYAPPPPAPAPHHAGPIGSGEFRRRFAKGAGLPEDAIALRDEGQLAEMLGAMVRTVTENLRQLNTARAQSKGMMRSSNQTMIQATENNPLRFSPTADDALRIMFGPPSRSYLDPYRSLEQSFSDLKKHQVMVFSSMQSAVSGLMAEIDPKRIESAVEPEKGVGALLSSRKGKLWDHYVTVWQAKAGKHEQGMLGVYMLMFADAYDRSSQG